MYRLIALWLLCFLVITPLHAQDNDPYQIALQRIREAAETNATELDLDYLYLTALPPEIGQLHNLEYLYVNGYMSTNGLTTIPPEIGQLTNLVELWLSGQDLATLPPEIGNLANLDVLVLNDNNFTELPSAIGQLHNLRGLAVSNNQLTDLPAEIGQLSNLELLAISWNHFQQLPPVIGQITNLKILDASANQLTSLPNEITHLANLQTLDLEFNQFRYLSDVFLELKLVGQGRQSVFRYARNGWGYGEADVLLRINPLISPPSEIAEQGLPAIQQYLREQHSAQIHQLLIWIALSIVLVAGFVLAFRLKTRSSRKPKKKREMMG